MLEIVDVYCSSLSPQSVIVTFNEAVFQDDASEQNDALHIANYTLNDNFAVEEVQIFSISPYGSRAVLLVVDSLILGDDRYNLEVINVEATNGDVIVGTPHHIVHAGGIQTGSLGLPTFTSTAPPAPPDIVVLLPWYRVELGHIWQDVAGTIPAIASNDPVARLDDQSGAGLHLIQAVLGLRPLLKLNVQNGKPGLLFDGVDDELDVVGLVAASPTIGSAFVIAKNASAAFPSYSGCFTDQSPSDNDIMFTGNSGTNDWYNGGRFSNTFTGLMYVDGDQTWDQATLTDGHASIGVVTGSISKAVGNDGGIHFGLQLGRDRGYGGRYWGGHIFEAGISAIPYTDPQRALLDAYFQSYWGTPP